MGVNNNIDITKLSPKIQEMLNSFSSTITDQVKVLAKETAEDLTETTKSILLIKKQRRQLQVVFIHGMLKIQNTD